MRKIYSDLQIRKFKLPSDGKRTKLPVGESVYVVVEPVKDPVSNFVGKSFIGRCNFPKGRKGKQIEVRLGSYGIGRGRISIKEAKDKFRKVRDKSDASGLDPREILKKEKNKEVINKYAPTFENAVVGDFNQNDEIDGYSKKSLFKHLEELFPICRSITGEGIRKTLAYFESYHPELKRIKIKSGAKVLDWEIPLEWNIKDAYIEHINSKKRYAEFKKNNLHVVGYSYPVNKVLNLEELIKRIHTFSKNENWIPYITSYYKKYWGFCMSAKEKKTLPKGSYKIFIDSNLKKGTLDLSHAIFKGESEKEILFSSYVCHPSMANNELSGPVVLNAILDYLKKNYKDRKYTYRFILQPETIGAISYISKYKNTLTKNVICGFNLSCVGDERGYSYVSSPYGDTLADKAIFAAISKFKNFKQYSYLDRGSDERQFCSPGIRLPLITFSKSKFGKYPEYHSSGDNLGIVSNKGLMDSFKVFKNIIDAFENGLYPKLQTYGEPQLGKRNLYPNLSTLQVSHPAKFRMDFLAYCDGKSSIFDICKILNCDLESLNKEYKLLKNNHLLS